MDSSTQHNARPCPEPTRLEYTTSIDHVVQSERDYIRSRRLEHALGEPTDDNLVGLCLSGGGVRSATFSLGVLQTLIRKGLLKQVDYLSTVSGGGYIGACLTSLMSGQSRDEDPAPGVTKEDSPFVGLREFERDVEKPKLSVRHQMHHLRTHGEYLTRHTGLLTHDLQRAVGTVASGLAHNLILFGLLFLALVSVTLLTLTFADPDLRILAPDVSRADLPENLPGIRDSVDYVLEVLQSWYATRIYPVYETTKASFLGEWRLGSAAFYFLLWGSAWSAAWMMGANSTMRQIAAAKGKAPDGTYSGWNAEDFHASRLIRRFNVLSVVAAGVPTLAVAWIRTNGADGPYMAAFLLPLCFSIGGAAVTYPATHLLASYLARKKRDMDRVRRGLLASIQGACVYGFVTALLAPPVLVLLLTLAGLPLRFFLALVLLLGSYLLARTGSRHGPEFLPAIVVKLMKPLTGIGLFLALAFAFSAVAEELIRNLRFTGDDTAFSLSAGLLLVALASAGVLFSMGLLIDSNRISPHYFYRDRLAEAYLKTDARAVRPPGDDNQGMPLTTVRNDEDLRLSEIGQGKKRPPYHLIVAALNLRGSKELNRKTFLSEHFVFSKNYIGCRVTGWAPTGDYDGGGVRLSRAMTISAAAAGSAMGVHSFGAQAFLMTLFNARLGYWMENPWFYRPTASSKRGYWTNWLWYLGLELTGRTQARERLVNVSDGGHTGDNLGLLPLLQRRCGTIIICDAEADGDYDFGSFNNAVRMAYIEENISIDIDLDDIVTREDTGLGYPSSRASVATGTIRYPQRSPEDEEMTGRLIYLKSSVSGHLPVNVSSYLKNNPAFPHESTADQFFNDAQFEAYRALGAHVAGAVQL